MDEIGGAEAAIATADGFVSWATRTRQSVDPSGQGRRLPI